MTFRESVADDINNVFLNDLEFAEEHDLNGTKCLAVLQDITLDTSLSTGGGITQTYPGLYGSRLMVNCRMADLPEAPVPDQLFKVDGALYLVESCAHEMGMYVIQLVANDR